ncbi:MAG TPA: HlyD family secretion protein [Bacteroidia bacterium]|nr:HlyD family secretion protein [Bacteroidia bacterium]
METPEKNSKKNKMLPIILGLVVLVAVYFGVTKYVYALHHEDTDDAQIDGDISPVLARVAGYVNEIRFEENQPVNKGDTLVKLDDRDLRIKVEQAQAAVENAAAGVSVASANVTTAQANAETAKFSVESAKVRVWKATQDFSRYENLLKDKAVTQQQFDAAKAEKESAEAQLSVAVKQLSAAGMQVEAANKQVEVANSFVSQKRADLDFALLQLSYATVISPAKGKASRKNIQLGQLVSVGYPMFAVVSDQSLYVIANFKETQLEDMQKDQKVEVVVDAFPNHQLEGKIYSISSATGAKFSLLPPDNATGNFVKVVQRVPVKIVLNTDAETAGKIRPGMSVKVSVLTNN